MCCVVYDGIGKYFTFKLDLCPPTDVRDDSVYYQSVDIFGTKD